MIKKAIAVFLFGVFLLSIAGCVVHRPYTEPPPPKREIRSTSPGANYVWVQGHWEWRRSKWVWIGGYWIKKRPGKTWIPGHWGTRRGRRVWIPGHWRRG